MNVRLREDGAVEIDCPTILEMARGEHFAKGFVVILSQDELDVEGVYTAGSPALPRDEVRALEVEYVPLRLIEDPRPLSEEPQVAACTGRGCCCNSPRSESDPNAGLWPDAPAGYECRALEPGGVFVPSLAQAS